MPSNYEPQAQDDHIGIDEDEEGAFGNSSYTLKRVHRDQHVEENRLAWLMLGTALAMLIMTIVPVVTDIPNVTPWFPGDTLWRLFDPVITVPLNLFIMTRSDVMKTGGKSHFLGSLSERSVAWLLWSIGVGIYVQGHGIHTAAAMFKHPAQDFNNAHPELVTQYPVLNDIYLNMENLWEHEIAHYMYAFGGMWMSWVQLFVYRSQVSGPLPVGTKIVWAIGSLLYGLLLAGVAIEFPWGLYVGLIYTIVIGAICISLITLKRQNLPSGGLFTMGRRMVLQYYLGACVVGLIVVIAWIGKYGFQNRKAAGVAT